MTKDMAKEEKLAIITEVFETLKEMLSAFVQTEDDEGNVIFLVALFCSKNEAIEECFDLIL